MRKDLPKVYTPEAYEDKIYEKWEKSGYFNPDVCVRKKVCAKNAKPFTIILPPPNITDKLHLGHGSTLAIEDLLIRYHRMKGDRTLWLPGTDHAAIATQNVVERKLLKEEGKTRHDLGKEKFLKKVWDFVEVTQATILNQTRKMGASLDWSRQAFTLDEPRKKAVRKMFVDMYKEGIIYQGERIVNWCPRCHSTLADDEVNYKEQKAKLYTFKYSKDFPFAIATTRPETKLGDTAVAVNPKDKRYKKYIGKIFKVDFVGAPLKLKIIADRNVDIEFGAGTVGVTPAHSMVDWQMAEANKLPIVKVIDEDGKINNNFGKYSGKDVLEAREMIAEALKKQKLLEKEEEINNNLSVCYRCGTPIEPLPSKQWFVSVDKKLKRLGNKSLKEKAIEAAKSGLPAEAGKIEFIPERFTKKYLDWMENLHDWCISRQIWFGHEIPVWYREHKNTKTQKHKNNDKEVYVGLEASKGEGWVQDPDTLDTWFSSGMWTFSTLGWPDNFKTSKKSGNLAEFHPTQILDTGYEILTLWVSRMIMMSLFALEEIPFEKVYLHGMVLDEQGKKMSKSRGNGIDPIDVIKKYGTDAVRLSLLIGNTPGNDTRIFEEKIAGFRNFTNKLWNISRFIMQNVKIKNQNDNSECKIDYSKLTLADKYILSNLWDTIKLVNDYLDNYKFSSAGEILRNFTWDELADWYLEATKFQKGTETEKVLLYVLRDLLKLWHPFMPFVTETIWQEIYGKDKFLMVEKWPEYNEKEAIKFMVDAGGFQILQGIIIGIRNARAENRVDASKKVEAVIISGNYKALIEYNQELIKGLRTGISKLEFKESGEGYKDEICVRISNIANDKNHNIEIYLIGVIDKEKEEQRIKKEIVNLEKMITATERKLKNKEFTSKAPAEIVKKEEEKLKTSQVNLEKLKDQIKKL
ncbi:MAG: valine--tRNA ligase [Patescibacteria group bacterium]|nr:valine--tRNA ligase [Patescibacteria group bacterium]